MSGDKSVALDVPQVREGFRCHVDTSWSRMCRGKEEDDCLSPLI